MTPQPFCQCEVCLAGNADLVDVIRVSLRQYVGGEVIDPALDPSTRTAKVRIEVSDPRGRLKPEMFAEATIFPRADSVETVLAIPNEAVQTVEGSPAVFVPVVGEANTFAKRTIRIGPVVGGMVPVLSGLEEGERYVASGSFILKAELGKSGAAHEH